MILGIASEGFFFVRLGLGLEDELARSLFVLLGCVGALLLSQRWVKCCALIMAGGFIVLVCLMARSKHHLPWNEDVCNVAEPHIRFLQDQLGKSSAGGRVLCSEECARANSLNYFSIADLAGNQPVQVSTTAAYILKCLPRKDNEIHYYTPNQWWGLKPTKYHLWWTDYIAKRRFVNLLSVKYLVDSPDGYLSKGAIPGIRLVYGDSRCRIYEDQDCSPRAYACQSAVVVRDHEQALRLLEAGDGDFKSRPIIEDPQQEAPPWLTIEKVYPITGLTISELSLNKVAIAIKADRPGLVVLNDAYYPGWRAYVDGVEQPIFRVNSISRGVIVAAEAKMVEFVFRPRLLVVLATVSGASFLLCAIFIFWPGIERGIGGLARRLTLRKEVSSMPESASVT